MAGVVDGEVVTIGQMQELGRRVKAQAVGYEVLNGHLGFSESRRQVYNQFVRLSRNNLIECLADNTVMLSHNVLVARVRLEHEAREVEGMRQAPRLQEVTVSYLSAHQ